MKYIINYTNEGKILGFAKGDTDLNIEVSNAIWFEAQSYNKIIIDGENITFDKVDWRTAEEIAEQELKAKLGEAQALLDSTQFKFGDDYDQKDTPEWLALKVKRQEAREFIRSNDVPNP